MKNKFKNNYVFYLSNNYFSSIVLIIANNCYFTEFIKRKKIRKDLKKNLVYPTKKRFGGKLIWFHGASVGEILSIIPSYN